MGPNWPTTDSGPTAYSDPYSDNSYTETGKQELEDSADEFAVEPEIFEPVHAVMMPAPRVRDGRFRIQHLTQMRVKR